MQPSRRGRSTRTGEVRERPLDAPSLRALAIRLLARREYPRAELAQRLRARGASADDVEPVLDALAADGYLSDARFAHMLVQSRAGRFAGRAIAHELRERGVDREVADAALEPLREHDELAEATALWQRRFGTAPRDEREKARQVRFLLSRGYATGTALRVIKAAGAIDDRR
jgi:regulatory protein